MLIKNVLQVYNLNNKIVFVKKQNSNNQSNQRVSCHPSPIEQQDTKLQDDAINSKQSHSI